MSAETLRKTVLEEIEKLNATAMNNACGVRPNQATTADGLALMVVDNLAQARAYATCSAIIETEFRKLMNPQSDKPVEKPKVREIY